MAPLSKEPIASEPALPPTAPGLELPTAGLPEKPPVSHAELQERAEALSLQWEMVSADTAKVSPGGATFTVPAGWSIETGKDLVVLTPPETDTHVAIFDAGGAGDAKAAVTEAWAAYKGKETHPVKLVTPRPAREGWDERQVFEYETSPNERAVIVATALRAGTAWTVIVIDGTDPTVEKRSSPLSLILQSLRPKGYQRESFAGKQAHPLDAARIAQLTDFVQNSMKLLGIPGVGMALLALAVILGPGLANRLRYRMRGL